MTLRLRYIIFFAILHVILIIISYLLVKDNLILLLPIELLIIISIYISYKFYLSFIKPINLIAEGVKTIKDKDFSTQFVTVGQKDIDQLIEVYNAMIEHLREERTRQQEQHYFLERLIKASPSGVILLDFDDKIISLNPAAQDILNTDELSVLNLHLSDIPGSLKNELMKLKEGEWSTIRLSGVKTYRCHKAHFMDRGFKHHFILIEEITEELLKSERKAYEKVIRMMSHEINNTIGAVNSILTSCINYKEQLDPADREDYVNALNVAVNRSESLKHFVSSVADVVRVPKPMKEISDLHDLLRSVQILMSAELKKNNINWDWQLFDKPLKVYFDTQQMEQVIVNIIKNAIEAIEAEGTITIITQASPSKQLIIRNNGKPIPTEIKQNLFTPFYSSKKNGKGIGLTLTREILIGHGFGFNLESSEDGFTDFKIIFN